MGGSLLLRSEWSLVGSGVLWEQVYESRDVG
jgi:hypothetical protein